MAFQWGPPGHHFFWLGSLELSRPRCGLRLESARKLQANLQVVFNSEPPPESAQYPVIRADSARNMWGRGKSSLSGSRDDTDTDHVLHQASKFGREVHVHEDKWPASLFACLEGGETIREEAQRNVSFMLKVAYSANIVAVNDDLLGAQIPVDMAITVVSHNPLLRLKRMPIFHFLHHLWIHIKCADSVGDWDVVVDLAPLSVLPSRLVTVQADLEVGVDANKEHTTVDAAVVGDRLEFGEIALLFSNVYKPTYLSLVVLLAALISALPLYRSPYLPLSLAHSRQSPNPWLYRRYLAVDGNFVLDHLENRQGNQGVSLSRGALYMTEPKRYQKHILSSARELHEPPTCSKLRAVSEKNVFKKGYDVTGVVGIACARHGCFCPSSVVDLQKGERQKNVDYAVCQGFQNTNAFKLLGALLAYDVNCQYCVNFRKRILQGEYLEFDPTFPIDFVIGLFHVHGHKDECLSRFAPTFLPGAGVTSGEILESLWHTTNGAAKISRNMLPAGRWELLDACMHHSNQDKVNRLPGTLVNQLELARTQLEEASADLKRLSKSATKRLRRKWKRQMKKANNERRTDSHAMDVYNTTNPPAGRVGVAKWIAEAIDAQQAQIDLRGLIYASRDPSVSLSVDIATKSQALSKRVSALLETAAELFPDIDPEDEVTHWENDAVEVCVCEQECSCAELAELPWSKTSVDLSSRSELAALPLPSSFLNLPSGWNLFAQQEEKLRVAQAEESLEALRGEIATKSFLYRGNKDFATGKRGRTRAYQGINEVESRMRSQIKHYHSAVWALNRLAPAGKYRRFQNITRQDTRAVTSVYDPNRRGERNETLSWIFLLNLGTNAKEDDYLKEVYRVNWIRARSRKDRWAEEYKFVKAEMEWYVLYMSHFEERARGWANLGLGGGHSAYASRQADMWRRRGCEARSLFGDELGAHPSEEGKDREEPLE
ncbi:hypothetical protein NMY22_g10486 [Coprinellus aureogranulatus]|nr:hypothetical protein NMY22_g10486 [Coprinellus aureogranulatus]